MCNIIYTVFRKKETEHILHITLTDSHALLENYWQTTLRMYWKLLVDRMSPYLISAALYLTK